MVKAPTMVNIDLTNFKDTQGARVDPGDYHVIIDSYEMSKSRAGNTMITVWLRITEGDEKDSVLVDRYTITEKALWRVVGLLNAVGIKTPNKRLRLNPAVLVNKRLIVSVADGEEYRGRIPSNVVGWMKAKSNGPKKDDPWETDPDEEETEEPTEVDEEDEEDEPEPAPTPKKKRKPAPEPEPEEDEDDDEDDEEEPPAPPKKKPAKRKAKPAPEPEEDDEDEDDEDDDEVDLDEVGLR